MSESPTPPRSGPTRRASPDARRVAVPGSLAAAMPGLGAGRLVVWHGSPAEAAGVATATGAVLWHRDPAALCAELLELCPELDWVHSLWTGLGHLPLDALLRRRITVTTGRGVPAGPLAEWVLAALLWSAKRLEAATAAWRAGEWPEIDVDELAGCRIVVLGTGSIGRAVAVRAAALGVAVTGVARRPRRLAGFGDVLPGSELARACRGAAALVVAVPLTADTAGMVDREVLASLPDGALVVNVGRAPVIDEGALAAEVERGRLRAALDVWWDEPLPASSPWRRRTGVLASPHSAYRTSGFRRRHLERVRENVARYLSGRRLVARADRRAMAAMAATDGEPG